MSLPKIITTAKNWFSRSNLEAEVREAESKLPPSMRPAEPKGWQSASELGQRLTNAEASLSSLATATACANDQPTRSIDEMERLWAECKATAKASGVKSPTIHCGAEITGKVPQQFTPTNSAKLSLEARVAELERELAKAKAAPSPAAGARIVETAARTTATQLSAERRSGVPAGGWPKQEAMPRCPENITGEARKDWYRQMDKFGPDTAKYSPDAILRGMANHGTTSEEDRKTAKAELTRRGWIYDESAKCWSQSQV